MQAPAASGLGFNQGLLSGGFEVQIDLALGLLQAPPDQFALTAEGQFPDGLDVVVAVAYDKGFGNEEGDGVIPCRRLRRDR